MELKINKVESHLLEVTRKDLVTKSRLQSKSRYKKRLNYQVSNFRGVDLKQMFENDYFVFKTPIKDYVCTIAFPGVFTQLRSVVKETRGDPRKINLQMVIKALRRAFDATDDVKVDCTCYDFRYRYAYWATQNGYKYGAPENRPSDITNPDDAIGATCKHLDLLLSNKRWLVKAASTVNAFIKAYPDKASLYLYDEDELVDNDEEGNEEVVDDTTDREDSEVVDNSEEVPEEDSEVVNSSEEETSDESQEEDENKTLSDSLKIIKESMLDRVEDKSFLDNSDNPRDWIADQRSKIYEISNRMVRYSRRLDLENNVKFVGYYKYARKSNYSYFIVHDLDDDHSYNVYFSYRGNQYKLYVSDRNVKSNQDPQKIVKYVVDHLIYNL